MAEFTHEDELLLDHQTVARAIEYWLNRKIKSPIADPFKVFYISTQDQKGRFISKIRVILEGD